MTIMITKIISSYSRIIIQYLPQQRTRNKRYARLSARNGFTRFAVRKTDKRDINGRKMLRRFVP